MISLLMTWTAGPRPEPPNKKVTGRGGRRPLVTQSLAAAAVRCTAGFGGHVNPDQAVGKEPAQPGVPLDDRPPRDRRVERPAQPEDGGRLKMVVVAKSCLFRQAAK